MFVKYNGVLRGLRSVSPFLRNGMIKLCCEAAVFTQFIGNAQMSSPANGSLSFGEALKSLNKYSTTLQYASRTHRNWALHSTQLMNSSPHRFS